jgi:hypothetical protein
MSRLETMASSSVVLALCDFFGPVRTGVVYCIRHGLRCHPSVTGTGAVRVFFSNTIDLEEREL